MWFILPSNFFTAGDVGPAATVVYKRLPSMTLEKNVQAYARVLHRIKCWIGFSLLRALIMCPRGALSSLHCPVRADQAAIDLALIESRVMLRNGA